MKTTCSPHSRWVWSTLRGGRLGEEMSLENRCPKILPKLRRQWEGFGILVHCPCQKLANLLCLFPLIHQPLMDNLESQTYEVFEKDPIKYSQYQQVQCGSQMGSSTGPG